VGENKVQIVIEVDSAKGTAQVKAVGDTFAKLKGQASGLSGEFGKLSGATGKAAAEKKRLADGAREAAGGMDRATTSSMSLTSAITSLAGAVAAWKIAKQVEETALLAARVETLGVVVAQVGKNALYSAGEMNAYVEAVKKMGITTQESQQTVTRFTQAHLDLGKAADLARVAQDAAVIGNTNSSESLKGLMHGIVTLQPEILRTYGIIVNFEAEYSKFAASVGRTVDSLSSQEKQQIALNAVLEAGKGIAGSYEAAMGTVGKQINSLPRLIEEAKLKVGEMFTPAMTVLVQEFTAQLKDLDKFLKDAADNGDMERWATDIAGAVKEGIENLKDLIATIKSAIEIIKPFAGTAAELLIMGVIAEKALSAAAGIARMTTAIRAANVAAMGFRTAGTGLVATLTFFAAYEATSWLTSFIDGTRDAEKETVALTAALKLQKEELKNAEAAAKEKGEAQRIYEEAYTKQFLEDIRKLVAADDARNAAARKKREDAMKRQADADKKALERWEKEKAAIGKSGLEKQMALLEAERAAYERVVEDKIALEEWFAAEKLAIELKQKNQSIALYEELYKATAMDKYADQAIAAMKEILDAEEKKWAEILDNDDDAHALRIKREQEYVAKIKGEIKQIVQAEKEAAREVASFVSPTYGSSPPTGMQSQIGLGQITGRSTGLLVPVGWGDGQQSTINNFNPPASYIEQINAAAEEAAREASRIAEEIASQNEQIAAEYQREYEARVSTFESLRGEFTGYLKERERRNWGMTDYQSEFTRLSTEFGKAEVFETQIDLLGEMLDTLQELEDIEQDMLQASRDLASDLKSDGQSISDWLSSLGMGSLAPVQSAEAWDTRYNDLLTAARSDRENIAEFLSYAQEYLQFQKTYGTGESYGAAYGSVTAAVTELGGAVELLEALADLGLGTTTDDLNGLLQAFTDLGVPISALKEAAAAAKEQLGGTGDSGSLNAALDLLKGAASGSAGTISGSGSADSLTAALTLLKSTASTSAGSTGLQLLLTKLGEIPGSTSAATGETGLKKLFDALGLDFPKATGTSATQTGTLIDTLQATDTPFANVQKAINSFTTTGLGSIDSALSALATKLGITYTPGIGSAAGSAIISDYAAANPYAKPLTNHPWTLRKYGEGALEYIWENTDSSGKLVSSVVTFGTGANWNVPNLASKPTDLWYGKGGLTSGPSGAGELGPEWVVPTYEPERSRFLASAPPEFWQNLTPDAPDAMPVMERIAQAYGIEAPHREIGVGSAVASGLAKGGLTAGPSVAGELGPEPERSRFLASAPPEFWGNLSPYQPGDRPAPDFWAGSLAGSGGSASSDPEAIGRAIAAQIRPLLAALSGGAGAPIQITLQLNIDGRDVRHSVADGFRQGDRELVDAARRVMVQ